MPTLAGAEGAVVRIRVAVTAAARGSALPGAWPSTGIRQRVFPALGVDIERIRSARGMDGTFNVCDFGSKECVAVPHTDADLDVLTAGVSLPVFSPAVERDERKLVDAVWIKDTNVSEALRRGAEIGSSGASGTTAYTAMAHYAVVHMHRDRGERRAPGGWRSCASAARGCT